MFSGEFIHKTGKVDPIVRAKHNHPQRNRLRGPLNHRDPARGVRGWGWPAPPVGRPACWPHLAAPPSYIGSLPSPRFNLRRGSRSVRVEGSDEELSWIHGPIGCLVPPIKGAPYLFQKAFRIIHWASQRSFNLRAPYTNIHRRS